MPAHKIPIRDRIMGGVAMVPFSGCWIWLGCIAPSGYGMVQVDGQARRTHRVAYRLFVGEIPADRIVCHRCDVPACCNPAHLFLGTSAENASDMVAKGRQASGTRNASAKLCDDDIRAIRASSESGPRLARKYSVSSQVIYGILKRQSWTHVED